MSKKPTKAQNEATQKFIAEVRAAVGMMAFPEGTAPESPDVRALAFSAMQCVSDSLRAFDAAMVAQ